MAYDPLSRSTRQARTGLISIASAGAVVQLFGAEAERINLQSIGLVFDSGVVNFVIMGSLSYFVVSFLIGFYDDFRNRGEPSIEINRRQQEERFSTENIEYFLDRIMQLFAKDLGDREVALKPIRNFMKVQLQDVDFDGSNPESIREQLTQRIRAVEISANDARIADVAKEVSACWQEIALASERGDFDDISGYDQFRKFRAWIWELAIPLLLALISIGLQIFDLTLAIPSSVTIGPN